VGAAPPSQLRWLPLPGDERGIATYRIAKKGHFVNTVNSQNPITPMKRFTASICGLLLVTMCLLLTACSTAGPMRERMQKTGKVVVVYPYQDTFSIVKNGHFSATQRAQTAPGIGLKEAVEIEAVNGLKARGINAVRASDIGLDIPTVPYVASGKFVPFTPPDNIFVLDRSVLAEMKKLGVDNLLVILPYCILENFPMDRGFLLNGEGGTGMWILCGLSVELYDGDGHSYGQEAGYQGDGPIPPTFLPGPVFMNVTCWTPQLVDLMKRSCASCVKSDIDTIFPVK
jgi:predicted small secreted protein